MKFRIGDKVVYPSQGPCLIGAVELKMIAGRSRRFYRLTPLDVNGGAVFVPVDKVNMLRIRRLIDKSEIPKVLRYLGTSVGTAKNWRQRELDNSKLLSSGSAFDLAELVESLTELDKARTLSLRDRQILEKARQFLVCEISQVTGQTRIETEERIDRVLMTLKSRSLRS